MNSISMLSEADQRALEGSLKECLVKSESQWIVLADKGGNLLAQIGNTAQLDLGILTALGAGSFAATHELARRLGETEFASLYHEGKENGILMTALDFECLLITVFGKQTNEGLVRLYTQQAVPLLNNELMRISQQNAAAPLPQLPAETVAPF